MASDARRRRGLRRLGGLLAVALAATAATPAVAAGPELPPLTPQTRPVMFVGNNWDGTADIIDARTYERLGRINTIPDKAQRMREIRSDPYRLAFFLAIRQAVGEGNDQFTDDMFTSHDGRFVYVSRPSFADVVGIRIRTGKIVWRFPMEGVRSDHMAISPNGRRLLVSDSTANKVHELNTRTGEKTGEFPSGDSPHENNYSEDGERVFHASIGRVYTPTDRGPGPLRLVRDTTKGERVLQIADADTLAIRRRFDVRQELDDAGYEELESAVRPMALAPNERFMYFQVSFHHGFVEFDMKRERVGRVAFLPLSEEAEETPREQYLLDSAHHGLAMNEAGSKLCVAGTMSDYAAIVSRDDFSDYELVSHGKKPYWSTNGLRNTCWVSYSGDDEVAILDYRSQEQLARVPVGDHPQRVRLGVVRKDVLADLPDPGETDDPAPTGDGPDEGASRDDSDDGGGGGSRGGGQSAEQDAPRADDASTASRVGAVVDVGADGRLPFTGLALAGIGLLGALLLAGGLLSARLLRR